MKRCKTFSATIALAALLALPAAAQDGDERDDVASGETIAETWCSQCHAIDGGVSAQDAAPTFRSITEMRSDGEIDAFLARPHGMMPNIQLSREQIDAVIAYMKTLRQ